jgi:hypothetical protein
MADFITRWAEAIRVHEGTGSTDVSTRNNNPGNLKVAGTANPPNDERGFARFNTWDEGVAALKHDLQAKVRKYSSLNILQIMCKYLGGNPYAVPADGKVYDRNGVFQGNCIDYANAIAKGVGVPITTPIGTLG